MTTHKELLEEFKKMEQDQIKCVDNNPNDYKAEIYLSDLKRYVQQLQFAHNSMEEPKQLVYENIDYRSRGDNHSEVNKTPIFRGCSKCAEAFHWKKRQENSGYMKQEGLYYSMGEDEGQELNKKIVVYAERTYSESQQDDECIINSEWLD